MRSLALTQIRVRRSVQLLGVWSLSVLMREARNRQASTLLFRSAPARRFETGGHRAPMWQPKNLTRRCLQPTDA